MKKKVVVPKRRKREGKTDYKKRLNLLKSKKHRLVIRKTNKYIIAQIIESKEARDKVIVGINSKKLNEFGWKYSFKNIPACYLSGLILGKEAKNKGINEAVVDIGLHRVTKGNRLFAVVLGASKFLKIPFSQDILPEQERIYGKHISEDIEKIVKEIENKILK